MSSICLTCLTCFKEQATATKRNLLRRELVKYILNYFPVLVVFHKYSTNLCGLNTLEMPTMFLAPHLIVLPVKEP